MRPTLAVREAMTREFVGVSEGDEASEALSLLDREGAEAAVVFRGREAVGVFTPLSAAGALGEGHDATVGDLVRADVRAVPADASVEEAADVMAADGNRRLLVTEGEETVGLLTAHDVVAATTLAGEPNEGTGPATHEPDAYAEQSVCEACGALSGDLRSVEGRLLCAECAGS